MSMVVQHNMQAMNSNRLLGITTSAQASSTEKLSSGYKINRAADDAAGLTISEKMRKQIRGLDRASTNAEDGVSAVQTAEGALTEVHSMLQRMNELAVQAANGTNSESDRDAIQDEIDQLTTEIDRVAETTKFNEIYLLKGDPNGATKTIDIAAHDAGLDGTLKAEDDGTYTFSPTGLRTDGTFADDTEITIAGVTYTIDSKATSEEDDGTYTLASVVKSAIGSALKNEDAADGDTIKINDTTYTYQTSSTTTSTPSSVTKADGTELTDTDAAGFYYEDTTTAGTYVAFTSASELLEALDAGTVVYKDNAGTVAANNTDYIYTPASGGTSGSEKVTLDDVKQAVTDTLASTATAVGDTITINDGTTDTVYTKADVDTATNIGTAIDSNNYFSNSNLATGDTITVNNTSGTTTYTYVEAAYQWVATAIGNQLGNTDGDTATVVKNDGTTVELTYDATSVGGWTADGTNAYTFATGDVVTNSSGTSYYAVDSKNTSGGWVKSDGSATAAASNITIADGDVVTVSIADSDGSGTEVTKTWVADDSATTATTGWYSSTGTALTDASGVTGDSVVTVSLADTTSELNGEYKVQEGTGNSNNGSDEAGWYDANGTELAITDVSLKDGDTVTIAIAADTEASQTYTVGGSSSDEKKITSEDALDKIYNELEIASSIGTDTNAAVVNNGDGTFTITPGTVTVAKELSFNLHVGADADMTNKIGVDIETMNCAYLGIKDLDVVGEGNDGGIAATYAIDAISDAIAKVSEQRSALGAIQNRLEHTINNLDNVVENTTSAESRIRDTDMAEEMVEYSKNNILAQAGQAMLAQANTSTQGVLSLLG